jgi:hypothetical protein
MVVRDGKDVIAPKVHAIVRIVLHPIRAALFSIVTTIRTIIKGKRVSERVSLRARKKCRRLSLKILASFFSRSEIFERTFGLAHWVSLSHILRALKTKEEQNDDMESYYLLRE